MTTCARSQLDAEQRGYFNPQCFSKDNWNYSLGFRSQHDAGAQFVFADGSVHFVPQTVNYNTYHIWELATTECRSRTTSKSAA